jgi:hypothetical protein
VLLKILKDSYTIRFVFHSLLYWWNIIFCVGFVFLFLDEAQEDQTNTKDNIPPIEEAMERKPYGLRIF